MPWKVTYVQKAATGNLVTTWLAMVMQLLLLSVIVLIREKVRVKGERGGEGRGGWLVESLALTKVQS